jgi:hypothetical protein
MPGYSYGIPSGKAEWVPQLIKKLGLPPVLHYGCNVGGKLEGIEGSVCYKCYATRNFYMYSNVQKAQVRRLVGLYDPRWVEAITFLIAFENEKYFRWHDSGDLLGQWHLEKVIEVAKRLPYVKFWLPTKEYKLVRENLIPVPNNLIIRVSHANIDDDGHLKGRYSHTSSVTRSKALYGYKCPAHRQDNKCGMCRVCWDSKVQNVVYRYH